MLEWTPIPEPEARGRIAAGSARAPGPVRLVIARSTAPQRKMLTKIGAWFVALGLVTLGTAMFAAWWAIQIGLRPVQMLAGRIEAIDDRSLGRRLETAALPAELRSVGVRTNELLDRLERAFERERRFSADVAHELRTPLSVLTTELEVTLHQPRAAEAYRESMGAALDEVRHLSRLVERLLWLTRASSGAVELIDDELDLRAVAEQAWEPYAVVAASRGLTFEIDLPPGPIHGDPEVWHMIAATLLSNAATYTEPDGAIRVHADGEWVFAVSDSGPVLDADELVRAFDPFWRADRARTDAGTHCGIGLSLVRALAEAVGCRAAVEVDAAGLTFGLRREA